MNKQMLELYRLAHVPHTAIDPSNNMPYESTYFSADKFAELIVLEMLDITDAHKEVFQTDQDKAFIEYIKQSVKTHFGVEE